MSSRYVCRRCGNPMVWFFRWKHHPGGSKPTCPTPEPIERGGRR